MASITLPDTCSLSPRTLSLGAGAQDPHACQAGLTEELRAAVQEKRFGGGLTLYI